MIGKHIDINQLERADILSSIEQSCGSLNKLAYHLGMSYFLAKELVESDDEYTIYMEAMKESEQDKLEQTLMGLAYSSEDVNLAADCSKFILKNTKYAKKDKASVVIQTESINLDKYSDEELEEMLME